MKFFLVFVTSVSFCTHETFSVNTVLRRAFENISEALKQKSHMLSLVLGDLTSYSSDSGLFELVSHIPHVVTRFENESKTFRLNSSAIIISDSIATVQSFNKRTILPVTFSINQQLFIHCQDGTYEKIATSIGNENSVGQHEYFVVEEEAAIRLLTFVYYAPKKCRIWQLVEVNKFDKAKRRWQHENFWMDKFSNFHGCRIKVLFHGEAPEFELLEYNQWSTEITKCQGYACILVKDFSAAINYSYSMFTELLLQKWPDNQIELFIGGVGLNYKYTLDPKNEFLVTRPVCFFEHFFTVPPGEKYNGYEKMILPFDEQTWIWICITFASAFGTILGLKFMKPDIANWLLVTFGEQIPNAICVNA